MKAHLKSPAPCFAQVSMHAVPLLRNRNDLAIYVALSFFANHDGKAYASVAKIAERASVSLTQARISLARIVDPKLNLATRERGFDARGMEKPAVYTLVAAPAEAVVGSEAQDESRPSRSTEEQPSRRTDGQPSRGTDGGPPVARMAIIASNKTPDHNLVSDKAVASAPGIAQSFILKPESLACPCETLPIFDASSTPETVAARFVSVFMAQGRSQQSNAEARVRVLAVLRSLLEQGHGLDIAWAAYAQVHADGGHVPFRASASTGPLYAAAKLAAPLLQVMPTNGARRLSELEVRSLMKKYGFKDRVAFSSADAAGKIPETQNDSDRMMTLTQIRAAALTAA